MLRRTHLTELSALDAPARDRVAACDPAVAELPLVQPLLEQCEQVLIHAPWGSLEAAEQLRETADAASQVVAIGGGSVLDTAKVALALDDPATRTVVNARDRCGWRVLPDTMRSRRLFAVPTTIGTASEVSGIVSVVSQREKLALTSPALQPDVAVLDARLSAGLDRQLVLEGTLEALLRCVGPLVTTGLPDPAAEAAGIAAARRLADALNVLHGSDDEVLRLQARQTVLEAGAETQRSRRAELSTPFAVKSWFVANNVSHQLGIRKMQALASLTPTYWGFLARSESSDRLQHVWEALTPHLPGDPSTDPSTGLEQLLDTLGIAAMGPMSDDDIESIVRSCVRMWGGGLPMLSGWSADDIRTLLRGVRTADTTAAA
ncbi:iron-containing alcohol dehydrogenase [Yimella sp. NH-Cas1]|uniref:iron-containing alcohol dehydrogenase n=1 Tax=Yimella sp. NH-Cas1 TaxID=2917726 RepID=UPI001EFA955E|nr:iron-containing alcohol dehydrogenase [Yimella sp. NH-Cas1]MCG8654524.1 iron-containing alcohol dehydrogenase [Yimella sp. NH-Cas1]